jgi:hypothetical protein
MAQGMPGAHTSGYLGEWESHRTLYQHRAPMASVINSTKPGTRWSPRKSRCHSLIGPIISTLLLASNQKHPLLRWSQAVQRREDQSHHFEWACARCGGSLTICRTSEDTICIQHMAVAKAHTMVERTLRAHTLKRRSCEKRCQRRSVGSFWWPRWQSPGMREGDCHLHRGGLFCVGVSKITKICLRNTHIYLFCCNTDQIILNTKWYLL